MTNDLQIITNSRLKLFRQCKRKHYYSYELGIETLGKAAALLFGSAAHEILECMWEGSTIEGFTPSEEKLDPDAHARLGVMMEMYDGVWDIKEWETLATELEFNLPLINPNTGRASRNYRLSGKIDAIARNRETGEVFVIEHKTTSMDCSAGSTYWQKLQLDEQIGIYLYAATELGYNPVGCMYDVLRKSSIKPYKATPVDKQKWVVPKDGPRRLRKGQHLEDETMNDYRKRIVEAYLKEPSKYFARGPVYRTEKDQKQLMEHIWFQAKQMSAYRSEDLHPTNSDACFTFNRPCKFFDLCCETSDLENSRWIRKESIHQELQGEKTDETEKPKTLQIIKAR